ALCGCVPAYDGANSDRPGASQESKTSCLGSGNIARLREPVGLRVVSGFIEQSSCRAAIARRAVDRLHQRNTSSSFAAVADWSAVSLNRLKKILNQRLVPARVADQC